MSAATLTLRSWSYDRTTGALVFQWKLNPENALAKPLLANECHVRFEPQPESISESEVVDMFIGVLCPFVATKVEVLEVGVPSATEAQISFWQKYLANLVPACRTSIAAADNA